MINVIKDKKRRSMREEQKLKLSETRKRLFKEGKLLNPMLNKKHSTETKEKIRLSHLGKKNPKASETKKRLFAEGKIISPMLGKHHTKESGEKIGLANSRRIISEETRLKLKNSHLGKKHTEETKLKLRALNLGKKLSEEHKLKMRLCKLGKKLPKSSETKKRLFLEGKLITRKGKIDLNKYIEIICPCGHSFKDFKSNKRKYCSKECSDKSEGNRNRMRQARLKQVLPQKDTSPEVKIQNKLRELEIEFETHKNLIGRTQADIFIQPNIVIYCDGDFYHGCEQCFDRNKLPNWVLARQVVDKIITAKLRESGYIVLRLWEHEIKKNIEECVDKILFLLKEIEVNKHN